MKKEHQKILKNFEKINSKSFDKFWKFVDIKKHIWRIDRFLDKFWKNSREILKNFENFWKNYKEISEKINWQFLKNILRNFAKILENFGKKKN